MFRHQVNIPTFFNQTHRLPTADSWFEIVEPGKEVGDVPVHLKHPVLGYAPVEPLPEIAQTIKDLQAKK